MDTNQEAEETFDGIKLKWTLRTIQKNNMHENYMFELSFHRKYVHKIHSSYIPYVVKEAEKIKLKIRERNLYTNQFYNGE
ncbi:hypothetical protein L1049_001204 [Liquidambar formosana]|uniref:Uncharacterized protein n=1 Tax=Liquidambar formosana TaxID=63359 RepID=A0AAP0R883_LIQFO